VKIARNTTAKVHGILVKEVITVMTVLLSCSTLRGVRPSVQRGSRRGCDG
jgi:hypothetical protein